MSAEAERAAPGAWSLRSWVQVLFFVAVVKPFLMLFLGVRVRGAENLPRHGPFVLIANHSSHLDAPCLMSLFPLRVLKDIRPVAAADYFEANRLRSWFARTFIHILPISRYRITRSENPVEEMVVRLQRGYSLLLFPEGTRSLDGELGPFRPGVAHLAQRVPGVPIVPVYLANLHRCLPKGAWIPVPLFCEARVGAPVRTSGGRTEILEQLEGAVRELAES